MIHSKNVPGTSLSDTSLSDGPVRIMALSLIHHSFLKYFVQHKQSDMFST